MAETITFNITRADYIDAGRATVALRLRTRRFLVRMVVVAMIGALGGLWLGWWQNRSAVTVFAGIGALYAVALIVIILGGNYLLLPRRLGRLFDQQKVLDGDHGFTWNDEGVNLSSIRGQATYRWADYRNWTIARGLFLFYLNDQLYNIAPSRAMTAEQHADLYEAATRNIG